MKTVCHLDCGYVQHVIISKKSFYLGRTAILLRRRRQRKCLVVGSWWLHMIVIVVSEAAEEGAENTPAPMLL